MRVHYRLFTGEFMGFPREDDVYCTRYFGISTRRQMARGAVDSGIGAGDYNRRGGSDSKSKRK